ncbi:MAG: ATPase involved in chromosome partitioning-like protein, partial [Actinomycetia bacterium]|nr:ATPase involved in chromosome partitioning-like protein [Actinomycetes bacterium]
MAANDFNSSNNSGSGQQDDAYRHDGESAISAGSGKFPKLAPRKFAEDDDLPAADLPLADAPLQDVPLGALSLEALSLEDEPLEDEPLEDVPPMEQLPVLGGTYQPPSYGPPPSYEAEPERYMGRTSLRDPHPASHYGTPRTRAAAPPLATPPRGATPGTMGAPVRPDRTPLAATPMAAPQEMSLPQAEDLDLDLDLGPVAGPVVAETSDVLTAEWLLHGRRAQPAAGWRRTVYRATGGLVKVGESAANLRRQDLINRVRTPVTGGHHRVAVMSLKGGVGKTTVAV